MKPVGLPQGLGVPPAGQGGAGCTRLAVMVGLAITGLCVAGGLAAWWWYQYKDQKHKT